MGIGDHRLRYIRVTEHLLGYLRMSSPGQQDRGESMTKIVKAHPGQPRTLQERPEGAFGE
jgi:hypothetical protein